MKSKLKINVLHTILFYLSKDQLFSSSFHMKNIVLLYEVLHSLANVKTCI